jgi:hypothetical protein
MRIRHNPGLPAIVDDDESVQSALQDLIGSDALSAVSFGSTEQFLDSARLPAAVPSHWHLSLGTRPGCSGQTELQVPPANSFSGQTMGESIAGTAIALEVQTNERTAGDRRCVRK